MLYLGLNTVDSMTLTPIKSIFLLFFLMIGTLNVAQSQVNIPFESSNFPGKSKELKEALEQFKLGDQFYARGPIYFDKALEFYLKVMEFNPNNAELNFLIGNCYLNLSHDKLKAVPYLEKANQLSPQINRDYLFALGSAYQYALEFEEAIKNYEQYIELSKGLTKSDNDIKKATKRIIECESGMKLVRKPVRVRIDNLGSGVNTKFPEYAPVIDEAEKKLIFTARREETNGGFVDPIDSLFMEDIYITFKVDDNWLKAKNIGNPINTTEHDASVNLSLDGSKLLIYRTLNGGDLLESKLSSNKVAWSTPMPLNFLNSKHFENHATYTPDGSRIYFISNRPEENLGGKDIYYVENNGGEIWGPPTNLGSLINTPYDEDGLFFHPDGKTLYFSSKGHNSMGGFDIFYTTYENGAWTQPVNMGYPINSPDDDIYLVMSKDKKRAYFSSYREEGFGDKDIYIMTILDDLELMTSIQVTVLDTSNNKLLDALVEIRDTETGRIIGKASTKELDGEAVFNVPAGKKYEVIVSSSQFVNYSEILNIPYSAGDQVMARSVQMSRDSRITINGFMFDQSTLITMAGKIDFIDPITGEIITTAYTTPKSNQYSVQVPAGRKYFASIYASGYSKSSQEIDFSEAVPGSEITKSFGLTRVNKSLPSSLFLNIVDAKTGKPIKNAQVELQEVESEPILVYSKGSGYDCIIYPGQSIKISVKANDYMSYEEIFDIPFSSSKQTLTRTIRLGKLTAGTKIVIRNIFFDFNKATFRPNSFEALAGLKQIMAKYPTLKVEISGHTDNVGSAEFNQKLSNNRAKVVYDYLIRNGIDTNRLKHQGKGFSEPIAPNDSDENRQLNRRTEMYIIAK